MERGTAPAQARESRTLLSAALANGPRELLDFLLPLWAGAALGASATQVGVLVAVELAVSVAARPVAGWLADVRDRRRVAAAGALLYAISCLGYAFAGSLVVAYGAAAVGGVGGALLWVSVRAMAGERLAEDSAVYPRLTAAEENGAWIAFVAGFTALGVLGYRAVFLGCAAACVLAAVALASAPARAVPPAPPLPGSTLRRLRPMLLAVVITMTAEAAVGLLLLLHLQRRFDLEIVEIAYVFLPGAVAMALLPTRLHRFVLRYGRTRVLAVASVASAVFAASLAWAPNPWVIAALWILSGAAWAAVIPIQQAVIAEASGSRVGRGMGAYEAAVLLGGLIGSLAAGVLYDAGPWALACLLAAAVILSGAVLVPWSVRAVGVADVPPPTPSDLTDPKPPAPTSSSSGVHTSTLDSSPAHPSTAGPSSDPAHPSTAEPSPERAHPSTAETSPEPAYTSTAGTSPEPAHISIAGRSPEPTHTSTPLPEVVSSLSPGHSPARDAAPAGSLAPSPTQSPYRKLAEHAAVYAAAQIVLVVLAESWLLELARGSADVLNGTREGGASFLYSAGRIWTFIFVIDIAWTLIAARRSRRPGAGREDHGR
ncbi:MFS transporter [Actinoplanes sp. M2I2]|uniref:MFS transporter n=1 Tax=Actinoplanes sp. M2I2 TaxID=1734444 RepID=UPI002021A112|nr:MFS transporter [Actinoplanes sp. M2I2]